MILFTHKVELRPGKKLLIVPFGDVHYNLDGCNKTLFHDLIKHLADRKKSGDTIRMLGCGDYCDPFSTSEKQLISGLHDCTLTQLDKMVKDVMDDFFAAITPVKDCIEGLVEGHHFHYFQDPKTKGPDGVRLIAFTSTQYLCMLLGLKQKTKRGKYLGKMALGTISVNGIDNKILVHHGYGGGASVNAAMNKRKRVGTRWNVDMVFIGHDHILKVDEEKVIKQIGDEIVPTRRYYVATGSYLEGYQIGDTQGSYIEQRLYDPVDLGSVVFELEVKKGRLETGWEYFK